MCFALFVPVQQSSSVQPQAQGHCEGIDGQGYSAGLPGSVIFPFAGQRTETRNPAGANPAHPCWKHHGSVGSANQAIGMEVAGNMTPQL